MLVGGIDVGTQSVKVLIYDSSDKEIKAIVSSPLELISYSDGTREQKAEWYIDAIKSCFDRIDEKLKKEIKALGVSGQQHGLVPISSDGEVLWNVKLWCDTSTLEECKEIEEKAGGRENVIKMAGNPILPGYTASKILFLKNKHPEVYDKAAHMLLVHDYINYFLTGKVIMERGDASGTALMDIRTGEWCEDLVSLISPTLLSKLPPILQSPAVIGDVKRDVATMFGISEDVVVVSGGGDNMMSAIGTGALRDGEITISLGTSGTLFASSSTPLIDDKCRLASFSSSHSSFLPLLCNMNCTVAEEVLRKEMGMEVKEFVSLASKAPLGSEGLVLLPFFNGERIPDYPNGEAVLGGMNMTNVKKENIARSALEGVSFEFLLGLEAFKELSFVPKRASLTGGGSKSEFWRQMISDITGLEIRCPQVEEAAAFGSALEALAVAEGRSVVDTAEEHLVFDEEKKAYPNMENHEKYKACYEKWKKYSSTMAPLFS